MNKKNNMLKIINQNNYHLLFLKDTFLLYCSIYNHIATNKKLIILFIVL